MPYIGHGCHMSVACNTMQQNVRHADICFEGSLEVHESGIYCLLRYPRQIY
jgi:hypothetical protein